MKVEDKINNFLSLDKENSSYNNSLVAILPIDASAKAIIDASKRLEHYDEEQGREISVEMGICTITQPDFENTSFKDASKEINRTVKQLLTDRKFAVVISADHSYSICAITAHAEKYKNLSILHLDSKANLKTEKQSKNPHDALMRNVSEICSDIVQVGIRSISKSENEFKKEKGIKQFLATEIKLGMYGTDWQELVQKELTENVYISIDLSVFDPSIFPSVENPEPGGLLWDEILYLIKIIGQDKSIVGFDICGFYHSANQQSSNYYAAKLIYKILNYAF